MREESGKVCEEKSYVYQVCGEKGFEKNCVLKKECKSVSADIIVGEGMCSENSDVSSCIFRESAGKCVLTETCYCRRSVLRDGCGKVCLGSGV